MTCLGTGVPRPGAGYESSPQSISHNTARQLCNPVNSRCAHRILRLYSPERRLLTTTAHPSRNKGDLTDFATAVVIIKNNYIGRIKWEQMVFLGNPEFGVDLHPIDFTLFAHACGGNAIHLEDRRHAGNAIDQALRFAESLVRGEPDAAEIFATAMKDKARQIL